MRKFEFSTYQAVGQNYDTLADQPTKQPTDGHAGSWAGKLNLRNLGVKE